MSKSAYEFLITANVFIKEFQECPNKNDLSCPCASFNWAPCHAGVLWEWRCSFIHVLTSALDGGEWSDSRSGRFTPRERAPGTHWRGGWVGPRTVLYAVVKRKIPSPLRESKPRIPIVQPVAQLYTTHLLRPNNIVFLYVKLNKNINFSTWSNKYDCVCKIFRTET
jgi:hypothetical protein